MKTKSVAIFLSCFFSLNLAAAIDYQIIDLGPLHNHGSIKTIAVNDSNRIVMTAPNESLPYGGDISIWSLETGMTFQANGIAGSINNSSVFSAAFMIKKTSGMGYSLKSVYSTPFIFPTWWNTFNLSLPSSTVNGIPTAINNLGNIGGIVQGTLQNWLKYYPVFWDSNGPHLLNMLHPNDTAAIVLDMNNLDQMVGYSTDESLYTACLWQNSAIYALNPLNGDVGSAAFSVNDTGTVIGYSYSNSGLFRAACWENNAVTSLPSPDSSPYAQTWAQTINNAGGISGKFLSPTGWRACLWDQNQCLDLNNYIDTPGWILQNTFDINNNGWIVGSGTNPQGLQNHAFVLIPIPEPASLALLLLGALSAVRRTRN